MNKKAKRTTKGNGFFLLVTAAVFIVLLSLFVTPKLEPLIQAGIDKCQVQLDESEAALQQAQKNGEPDDVIKDLQAQVKKHEKDLKETGRWALYYNVGMIFLVGVLAIGAIAQSGFVTRFTRAESAFSTDQITMRYYPMICAPVAAACVLLAVGYTYRSLFSCTLRDLVMMVAAVVVGAAVYLLYRHVPYASAKLAHRPAFGKLRRWFTMSDVVFLIPAVGMLVTVAVMLTFGQVVNGAKINLNLFGLVVQPNEAVKVLAVVLCATAYGSVWRVFVAAGVCAVTAMGQLLMRDMGAAIVIVAMVLAMLVLTLDNKKSFPYMENRKMIVFVLLFLICAFSVVLPMFPYAKDRFDATGNALEMGGQQADMLKVMAFGGLGGLGVENASHIMKIYAVSSDMAITGLTAVFGIGMLLIVLVCYAVFVLIPIRRYAVYRPMYFLSAQVAVTLLVQVWLNALGAMDILPFTGVVAPFISTGGTSLITFCAMVGLVLASLHPVIKPLEVTVYE